MYAHIANLTVHGVCKAKATSASQAFLVSSTKGRLLAAAVLLEPGIQWLGRHPARFLEQAQSGKEAIDGGRPLPSCTCYAHICTLQRASKFRQYANFVSHSTSISMLQELWYCILCLCMYAHKRGLYMPVCSKCVWTCWEGSASKTYVIAEAKSIEPFEQQAAWFAAINMELPLWVTNCAPAIK